CAADDCEHRYWPDDFGSHGPAGAGDNGRAEFFATAGGAIDSVARQAALRILLGVEFSDDADDSRVANGAVQVHSALRRVGRRRAIRFADRSTGDRESDSRSEPPTAGETN